MDFYPYLSAEGELYVSAALFSQFDCIKPVFVRSEDPIHGPWAEADSVLARAAASLESEILNQITGSTIGDAFDPLPDSVPVVAWKELGLELPASPRETSTIVTSEIVLPRRWTIEPPADEDPRLVFRFPAPLERYFGEVRSLSGELVLGQDRSLDDAAGWVETATASVTMGEVDLDRAIHDTMIHVAEFPTSRFTLGAFDPGPWSSSRST